MSNPSTPKPATSKFQGIVVDSSRTTPNFKIPAKTNRTLPTPPGATTAPTPTTPTTTAISPDTTNNVTTQQKPSEDINTPPSSSSVTTPTIKPPGLKPVVKVAPRPVLKTPATTPTSNVNSESIGSTTTTTTSTPTTTPTPTPPISKPLVPKPSATPLLKPVIKTFPPQPSTPTPSTTNNVTPITTPTPTPTPISTNTSSNSTENKPPSPTSTTTPTTTKGSALNNFKCKPLPSVGKPMPTVTATTPTLTSTNTTSTPVEVTPINTPPVTPKLESQVSQPITQINTTSANIGGNLVRSPSNTSISKSPSTSQSTLVRSISAQKGLDNIELDHPISETAKKATEEIAKGKKKYERVRVLSNKKGDFNSLNLTRGDIIDVIEKGEKDTYFGSNGYKTAQFSISNTKSLYPLENNPPKTSVKAIAIKDIKSNRNFTIIRGDILCILEKRSETVSAGRVKVGLDGWGEMGEFPLDSIRVINDQEYLLYSDLLNTIIEVSEKLMDPESLINSGTKESEKEIEKRQLALRDKVKNVQIIREKILVSSDAQVIAPLQIELRKDIETIRSILSNEFYIINDRGQICTDVNTSPLTILKEHYQLSQESQEKKWSSNKQQKDLVDVTIPTGASSSTTNGKKLWDYGQLVIDIKFSRCTLPKKNLEFYFSLYNFTQSKYLTEQVQVSFDQSSTTSTSSPSAMKFLFKNIESTDISEDVCLVCKVIRKGSIKDQDETKELDKKKGKSPDTSQNSQTQTFRRPYAYSAFKFTSAIFESQVGLEREVNLQFYTSQNESTFLTIPDILMRGNEEEIKKQIEPVPKLAVGVSQSILPVSISFYDQGWEKFVEKYPISYSWIKSEKLAHKILLADKIFQFYLTIESGKFTQGKKLELCLKVRSDNGDVIQNCVSLGMGSPWSSEIKTIVCYNNTTPVWNETIQFAIPPELFLKSHLLFTIRNCSNKEKDKNSIFAFSFMRLAQQDQTAIQNSDHIIQLFKSTTDQFPVQNYIDINPLVSNTANQNNNIRKGEFIKIRTHLNSSEFIQHQSIHQLINWKAQSKEDLLVLLDKFKFVDPIQIVRNLTKVLDALFKIYDTSIGSGGGFEVYNTIVFVIGLLTDERTNRFKNFKPELDLYINNQFSVASAHKHILKCISMHLQEIKESSKISSTLKSLEYMFRLIVKSRLVYLQEKADKEEESWKKELLEFLGLINRLMSNNAANLIVTQTLALRNFPVVMTGLQNFFTKKEQCKILNDFIEAIHYTEKQEHLNSYKLSVYHKILSTHLILDQETLEHLIGTLVATIDQHLTRGSELKLSTQLLSLLLESLESIKTQPHEKQKRLFNAAMILFTKVMTLNDNLLSSMTADFQNKETFNYDSTFLISNFFALLHYGIIFKHQDQLSILEKFIEDLQSEHLIKLFLRKLFRILEGLLNKGVYSNLWPTLQLFQHNVTLTTLLVLSPYFYKYINIVTPNLPTPPSGIMNINGSSSSFSLSSSSGSNIDIDSWNTIFNLHFSFLTSQTMKTPNNRIHRLKYIKKHLHCILVKVLNSIRHAWDQLKSYQSQYIQYILPNLLYSLLNGNDIIYEFIQDLFLVVIKKEYQESRSLKRIESRAIEILDKIVIRERISDEEIFKSFFKNRLFKSLVESKNEINERDSNGFTNNIIQLLSLLFDFRTLPTDRAFEEERTIATLKMMEYFKDRKDTYIKYLHELLNQHMTNGYYTEAGFTFLLHSDLYEWSDLMVPIYSFMMTPQAGSQPQSVTMPQETQTDRKIRLIKFAIQYLDKGQVWEKCISLIQDLRVQYELQYNFKALAEISFQEAEFYEKILNTERFFAEYFRVGYYGKKFPVTIQGKEFLYRGFELERLSDFSQRILAKFPNAELLKSTSEPTAEIQNSDGQYLLITIVTPSCHEEMEKKQKQFIEGTPTNSKNYLKKNDVNLFVYSKPFEMASEGSSISKDPNNKFGSLWIKNHFLFTESSFPTIHRRSEVIKKSQVDLSPLENAINSVSQKNEELDEMVKKYERSPQLNLNPLAMALNGSIDAAVNGGVSLYKDAFFTTVTTNKNTLDFRLKLVNELKKQVDILGKGLHIHSQRCPEELRGLHEKLESFFPKFKSQVLSLS
ncbi:DOCK family protein [Tieghemostelium lacteum]|uniref:DOCK family protein n=1 Tax=Tieghemostelium lacteum TaxID=361077 RepID=A0A151ZAM1_TIELA|nr:DOCK family protein [Tieghemostelium lacteum]|eukprot:KYQ90993.1 DOCK family protein [Tieghemostelium lacteum]